MTSCATIGNPLVSTTRGGDPYCAGVVLHEFAAMVVRFAAGRGDCVLSRVAAFGGGELCGDRGVELHADGTVWYDVRAFSRPRYWPVRLAKPLARRLQRKFVRDSQRAMQQAVKAGPAVGDNGRVGVGGKLAHSIPRKNRLNLSQCDG